MGEVKAGIRVDEHILTVPVRDEVTDALVAWMRTHMDEVVEVLKPFGLHPNQLTAPRFERAVTAEDIR